MEINPKSRTWNSNSQFLPLSETKSLPITFMWRSPPPPPPPPPRDPHTEMGFWFVTQLRGAYIYFLIKFLHWKRARLNSRKVNFAVSDIMVENSIMHSFSARASYAEKCLQQQPTIWWKTRDENDVPRVPIVRLILVSPCSVDCSLAVTNNSPVGLVILLRSPLL